MIDKNLKSLMETLKYRNFYPGIISTGFHDDGLILKLNLPGKPKTRFEEIILNKNGSYNIHYETTDLRQMASTFGKKYLPILPNDKFPLLFDARVETSILCAEAAKKGELDLGGRVDVKFLEFVNLEKFSYFFSDVFNHKASHFV